MRSEGALGLRELDLRIGYDTADKALREFYVPALSRAIRYDRSVGYFRASALAVAARGVSRFIAGGGTMRMLVGAEFGADDAPALRGVQEVPNELAERLRSALVPDDEIAQRRLEVLAWLAREGRLHIRVAVAVGHDGEPVPPGDVVPYFHEKIGLLYDRRGDGVAFQGSVNESASGWTRNFESFSVYRSWDASADYFALWARKFQERWNGNVPGFRVFELPDAVRERLVSFAPPEPPRARDPEEQEGAAEPSLVARVLLLAPRLVGAADVAVATTGVTPFPHQTQVVERLAGEFPRSWLVADEVGLGKTVSAGLALRRLLLGGEVRRALILAPAAVCTQWQDELFEKLGLWACRYDNDRVYGPHPDDVEDVRAGTNPFTTRPLLIVSSHLARRRRYQELLLAAPPPDLLIVDEAHHARRQGTADLKTRRPSRLMELLDRLLERGRLPPTWLLTATPMQVHQIELADLLRYVGLVGPLVEWPAFEHFHRELTKRTPADIDWPYLATMLAGTNPPPVGPADLALLRRFEQTLGPVRRARIERFEREPGAAQALADELGPEGRAALRDWVRARSPVGQCMTRHTRQTLRQYRDAGLLGEPVADRDVRALPVQFTEAETELYEDLDALLDRLMQAHGTRQGAGFVLTVYRRRLTSSWVAIQRTLRRRLDRERPFVELSDLEEEPDNAQEAEETPDEDVAVPLTLEDREAVERYIRRIDSVADSKFDRLRIDLDAARSGGESVIVFTQFTDTLMSLRDRLVHAYRDQLATFTGDGAQRYNAERRWVNVSRKTLVEGLRSGSITILLANDAASEGLNLQSCSYLINYDLPWNPMKVEQRIGRIDRIGQARPIVKVRNYVIPGTVEESVYSALADRIDLFQGLVGALQPILGATEEAFKQIFRAPKSERWRMQTVIIRRLREKIDELQRTGIDIEGEDPYPLPPIRQPFIRLDGLHDRLLELDVTLGGAGRPATSEPRRVSREREGWAALASYGHPNLEDALRARAPRRGEPSLAVAEDGEDGPVAMFRADRTPPEPLAAIGDLDTLGPAAARDEAEQLAAAVVATAVEERAARRRQFELRYSADSKAVIRERFLALARGALHAECERLIDEGVVPIDPTVVWFELVRDTVTGWAYAETFRTHLGLGIEEIARFEVPTDEGRIPRLDRVTTGRQLRQLMEEWRDLRGASSR